MIFRKMAWFVVFWSIAQAWAVALVLIWAICVADRDQGNRLQSTTILWILDLVSLFHAYPVDTLKLPTSFKAYFFGELLHESRVKRL